MSSVPVAAAEPAWETVDMNSLTQVYHEILKIDSKCPLVTIIWSLLLPALDTQGMGRYA
jgi:hypothetical protein